MQFPTGLAGERELGTAQRPSRVLRTIVEWGVLTGCLAIIAAVFFIARSPGSGALRPSTLEASQPPADAESRIVGPSQAGSTSRLRVEQHLLLVINDSSLGQLFEDRMMVQRLVRAERGGTAVPITFEIVRVAADDDLSKLLDNLRVFEEMCLGELGAGPEPFIAEPKGAEPCPSIRVIDLRTYGAAD